LVIPKKNKKARLICGVGFSSFATLYIAIFRIVAGRAQPDAATRKTPEFATTDCNTPFAPAISNTYDCTTDFNPIANQNS